MLNSYLARCLLGNFAGSLCPGFLLLTTLMFGCFTPLAGQDFVALKQFEGYRNLVAEVEITSIVTSQDYFIRSAVWLNSCGTQTSIQFLKKGTAQRNDLLFGNTIQPISQLKVIDGNLYAVATADARFARANPQRVSLLKIALDSQNIVWEQHINSEEAIETALDIQAYDKQGLMIYLRVAGGTKNVLYLTSRSSAELFLDYSFENNGAAVGRSFSTDASGNLYLQHPDRVVKLNGDDLTFNDTLWSFSAPDAAYTNILSSDAQRVTLLTEAAEVTALDSESGTLLYNTVAAPVEANNIPNEYLLQHPHVYFAWQTDASADSRTVRTSKFDIQQGESLWQTSTEFNAQVLGPASIALSTSGELIVAGLAHPEAEPDSGSVVLTYLDITSGQLQEQVQIKDSYKISGAPLVRNAGGASRVFFEKDAVWGGQTLPFRWSYEINAITREHEFADTDAGIVDAASAVKKIIPNARGYSLVEQHGLEFELHEYDSERRLESWEHSIYWRNYDLDILGAVGGTSNFAVVCRRAKQRSTSLTESHLGIPKDFEPDIIYIITKSTRTKDGLGIYNYWQRSGDSIFVNPEMVAVDDNFYLLVHDPVRDGEAPRIVKIYDSWERVSKSFPIRTSKRPEAKSLLNGVNKDILLLGAAQAELGGATVWRIESDSLDHEALITWPECDELVHGLQYDSKLLAVGTYTPAEQPEQVYAEILHADLSTGEPEWRLRLEHYNNAQLLVRDSSDNSDGSLNDGALFTIGTHHPSNSSQFDIVFNKIEENNGALDWQKTFNIEGAQRVKLVDAIAYQESIFVCGDFVDLTDSTHRNSFVLRVSSSGELLGTYTLKNTWFHDMHLSPDGDILLGASRINENCVIRGALFRLDVITGVEEFGPDKRSQQLHLFPNPSDGACSLVFRGVAGQKYSLVVRDLLGHSVLETSVRLEDPETGLRLETEEFESGVYSVEIRGNGQVYQGMLVRE